MRDEGEMRNGEEMRYGGEMRDREHLKMLEDVLFDMKKKGGRTDIQTDGHMDGWTDGRTLL